MSQLLFGKYPYLTPLSIESNEPIIMSESLNLKRKVIKDGSHRFEFKVTVTDGVGATLNADLMVNWMANGLDTPFAIPCPQHMGTTEATYHTNLLVTQSVAAGASSVDVTSTTDFSISAGRLVTIGSSTKLYMVTVATQSAFNSSSGDFEATLVFNPPLLATASEGGVVEAKDTEATVLNEPSNASLSYRAGVIQSASLSFVEHV
jgi:hypothetical protein